MIYYYVETNWSNEHEFGGDVLGIYTNEDDAKNVFRKAVAEEREYVENHPNYEIFEDTDNFFDAGEDGYYVTEHTTVMLKQLDMSKDYYKEA